MRHARRLSLVLPALLAGWLLGWFSHESIRSNTPAVSAAAQHNALANTVSADDDTAPLADDNTTTPNEADETNAADEPQDLATLLTRNDKTRALNVLYDLREHDDPTWPTQLTLLRDTLASWLELGQAAAVVDWTQAFIDRFYFDAGILQLQAAAQVNLQRPLDAIRTLYLQHMRGTDASANVEILQQIHMIVDDYHRDLKEHRNWKGMQALYEYLVSMEPNNAGYYLQLATALIERGAEADARLALSHVYDDPEHGPAALALRKRLNHAAMGEVRIPLQKNEAKHFTLDGLVDGKNTVSMLIDTGASLSAISRSTFDRLQTQSHPTFIGDVTVDTANGSVRAPRYRFRSLALAGITLRDVDMLVLDSLPKGQGLLGMNVLGQFPFKIDQENSILLLNSP